MKFTKEQKLYAEIVQKAWEDPQFKSDLINNPVATIEKATGQKLNLPQGKTLVVRDQTDDATVYINLPSKLNTEDVELNEDQLEAVAGGLVKLPGDSLSPIIDIFYPTPTFPKPPVYY